MSKGNVQYGSGFAVLSNSANTAAGSVDRIFTCSAFTLEGGKSEYVPLKSMAGTDVDAFAGTMDTTLKITAMDVSPLFRAYAANIFSFSLPTTASKTAIAIGANNSTSGSQALISAITGATVFSGASTGVYLVSVAPSQTSATFTRFDAVSAKELSTTSGALFSAGSFSITSQTGLAAATFVICDPHNGITNTDISQIKRPTANTIIFTSDNYQQSTNLLYTVTTKSAILVDYSQEKSANELQSVELEFKILNGDIQERFVDTGYTRG